MKKIKAVAIVVVCIIALVWVITPSKKFDEDLAGDTMRVCYEEVNVRVKPGTNSEIVDQYSCGAKVELSGNVYSSLLDDMNVAWYETSDGYWITAEALIDEYHYTQKFGR